MFENLVTWLPCQKMALEAPWLLSYYGNQMWLPLWLPVSYPNLP